MIPVNLFRIPFPLFPEADVRSCGVTWTALEIQIKASWIQEGVFEGDDVCLKETMTRAEFQEPTKEDAASIYIDSISSKAAEQRSWAKVNAALLF